MTQIFALLSGEHPTIPLAEVRAIIAAEGYKSRLLAKYGDVALLETSENIYQHIKYRSSMALAAGLLLFTSKPTEKAILRNSRQVAAELNTRQSLCVRVRRFKGAHQELSRTKLEREISSSIIEETNGKIRVDLLHPDNFLLGVVTRNLFILGVVRALVDRGAYDKRRPRRRPYFKPGVLEPRIARVFVNLSRLDASKTFYDPFMGTGGFMIEACMVGRYAVGSDADMRMVRGAKENLSYYALANFDVVLADATKLPIRRVECVGFDPPYGRATSTRRRLTIDLIQSTLREIANIQAGGGYVSLAYPSTIDVEGGLPHNKFRVIERHSMRVHRSLTRYIVVLRRI